LNFSKQLFKNGIMRKTLSILAILVFFTSAGQAQSLEKLFRKYSDDERFEYTSVGKGMLGFAQIFADFSILTEGQMEKITGFKMLKLQKDSAYQELTDKFMNDIDAVIEKGDFETSLVKREKDKRIYVYKRIDRRANADMLLLTKSNTAINFVWLKGKTSDEEADRATFEKEQRAKEEI